ncbi:hypothetical protein Scep_013057 [Stephania cephalantha]|uniref:Uncharacterized protein n=1 Tax=Stephania cephalantha TaxID=152367 RepID=A0AAP0JG98_9MAGN
MAEDSKWVSDSGLPGLGDFMGEEAEVCDQNQRYCLIENRDSDCFIVDIKTLSRNHGLDEELITTPTNSNSTVNMMRSFSKKESQRGESKSTSGAVTAVASCDATNGPSNEKLQALPRKPSCTGEEGIKTQVKLVQKQMERMANIDNEGKYYTWPRRYCKQRLSARLMDPRRVLFFFATLSSLGTIILIYFSLSIARLGDNTS